MAIGEYREFSLEIVEEETTGRAAHLRVRVFHSPAGESGLLMVAIPAELWRLLGQLERRKLEVGQIIALGKTLADLLLPDEARKLFALSLEKLKPNQGLRLRLRLSPGIGNIPWEYAYIQRSAGEADSTGFLALDPRISIVRHEALPLSGDLDVTPRRRRLLIALASPREGGYDHLDLGRERANIEEALQAIDGITCEFLENATPQSLADSLQAGADIFQFSGHGDFQVDGLGVALGTVEGKGVIVLESGDEGMARRMTAEQLAVNLSGHGVQLAILGACETGRRDGLNVWSGVAAALMEAGIPAVVAMQFKIWDKSAIAFGRQFYRALAAGLPLDQAVSAGRLAVFNLVDPLREDPQLRDFWRGWGVPVLYLRADQTFVLPAIAEPEKRRIAEGEFKAVIEHRFKEIGPRGKYTALTADTLHYGSVKSNLNVEQMKGTVEQVSVEHAFGGEITARGEAEAVDGDWTAVRIGDAGAPGPSAPLSIAPTLAKGEVSANQSGSENPAIQGERKKAHRPDIQVRSDQTFGTVHGQATGVVHQDAAASGNLDINSTQKIDTVAEGGTVTGAVFAAPDSLTHVGGRQFYKEVVSGDRVGGDKITVGNITGSTAAIGREAQTIVGHGQGGDEDARLFAQVFRIIEQRPEEPDVDKPDLVYNLRTIEQELCKGEGASPKKLERSLRWIADARA